MVEIKLSNKIDDAFQSDLRYVINSRNVHNMETRMDIKHELIKDGLTKISLSGRLDMQGAQAVEQPLNTLINDQGGKLIVDISNVSFLASLGLRCLLTAAKTASKKGGKVVLTCPQANVAEVLKVSGIYQIIKVFNSNDEAISALA